MNTKTLNYQNPKRKTVSSKLEKALKFSHKESLLYNTKVFAMDDDDSDDDQEEEEENVVNKTTYASLKRAWLAESNAPILLPFKSNVVRRFSNLIEERDAEIDRCERAANDGGDGTEMLLATIGREELNRMKYVLRSYLRTRIEKIQRFPVWSFVQQQVRHVRCGGDIYMRLLRARCFSSSLSSSLSSSFRSQISSRACDDVCTCCSP